MLDVTVAVQHVPLSRIGQDAGSGLEVVAEDAHDEGGGGSERLLPRVREEAVAREELCQRQRASKHNLGARIVRELGIRTVDLSPP